MWVKGDWEGDGRRAERQRRGEEERERGRGERRKNGINS